MVGGTWFSSENTAFMLLLGLFSLQLTILKKTEKRDSKLTLHHIGEPFIS